MVSRVGGSPETKKHLEDLGIVPGTEVRVVSGSGEGKSYHQGEGFHLGGDFKDGGKIFVTL